MTRDQAIDFLLLFDSPNESATTQHDAVRSAFEADMGKP